MTFPFSRLSPNDEESLYITSIISFYVKTDKVGESQRSKRRMCIYPILNGCGDDVTSLS